ncbi:MAG: hypothetical protein FWC79_01655 [Oscillospiraceae bacterium]|nr:hypothetical protein [Oscillospiraceae bacterium]
MKEKKNRWKLIIRLICICVALILATAVIENIGTRREQQRREQPGAEIVREDIDRFLEYIRLEQEEDEYDETNVDAEEYIDIDESEPEVGQE